MWFENKINEAKDYFKESEGTATFCLRMNEAFDILNCRSLFVEHPSKVCINSKNIDEIKKKVKSLISYIQGLTYLNNSKVIDGKRRAGFVGFIASLENIIEIYKNYIN